MNAIASFRPSFNLNLASFKKAATITFVVMLVLAALMSLGHAAGTTGTALKPAFDLLNDITNGYGKQLLVLIGFVAAGLAMLAAQAMGAVMKFIGFIVFLAAGLGAAVTLSGALI
ncbi:hypothetical protein JY96_21465 [Aquabacterium sp. NJ1]|uniref:hypothetical protein n=1 Tax=Aquabacterium sp. NJ1 TaxID=1538295 RepID=UPI00052C7091|nr:hypothetical protein [Aquabacterium sp. NJ1]KGM38737.1 hypothetical protein JY96_21465 [Aquabacterium sp. NJ1]